MASKSAVHGVDPLALPLGMRIGSWRILGWGGRGANATLYRVGRAGREEAGSFALKLAISPRDERFGARPGCCPASRVPTCLGCWTMEFGSTRPEPFPMS